MLKIFLFIVLLCVFVPTSDAQCTAPRVRRAWRNLQPAEQELYVEAVLLLKTRGIYNQFVNMHTSENTINYAHGASGFLPWHRWFLFQFENALRGLGTKYQCVTVPYWDWERDVNNRRQSSVLGRLFGTFMANAPEEGRCVTDGSFARWRTTENTCLRRAFDEGPNGMGFSGPTELSGYITRLTAYAAFRETMEGAVHGAPHVWIGGDMGAFGSPNDPLFFLHHANVDRIWAIWQDCHDHDRVDFSATTISNRIYPWFQTSNTPGIRDGPVDPMPFSFTDGRRDPRYYTGLPAGQNAPLPIDVMRIMGNRRIPTMSYSYDPADTLKGVLDRAGARCNWNWFVLPNLVLPNNPVTPPPPPPVNQTRPPPPPRNNTTPPPPQPTSECGNGIVEAGEECDQPARACGTCVRCRLLCGNGVVDCGEDCDDGNRLNGDACPSTCRRAHAWRRVRGDLTLKRDGSVGFDAETEKYMSGEISWEDYLFKRNVEQDGRGAVYSFFKINSDNSTDDDDGNSNLTEFRQLKLKKGKGAPVSSYLIFGKAPEAPTQWPNPAMEKIGSSVCEHNPSTKFASAKAKLQMLTYVEAEMEGCRKRANAKWIAMTRMNESAFQPPCKGALCCKVADMVSEKMVCDGGSVATPTCNATTCTWMYDCGNATSVFDNDDVNVTKRPSSPYRKYGALNSNGQEYSESGANPTNAAGLSDSAKIGIGVGSGSGVVIAVVLIVVIVVIVKGKKPESV